MKTDECVKQVVVDRCRHFARQHLSDDLHQAGCVYWAGVLAAELRAVGRSAQLQAGSAYFRISEQDPAERFIYQWQGVNEENLLCLVRGVLPELHAWVYLSDSNEVIDLTTGQQAAQALELEGLPCEYPHKPFVWDEANEGFDERNGVFYEADLAATLVVWQVLQLPTTGVSAAGTEFFRQRLTRVR